MSVLILKIIACLAMLTDHIGYLYGIPVFRAIGRIAFPIFAYLIANGFYYTKSRAKYLLRLAVFALISEIPFNYCFFGSILYPRSQNVFFTLCIGLICIWCIDELKRKKLAWLGILPVIAGCAVAVIIRSDYDYVGVLTVLLFYLFYGKSVKNRVLTAVSLLVVSFIVIIGHFVYTLCSGCPLLSYFFAADITVFGYMQPLRMLALIPIFMYNGKSGTEKLGKAGAKVSRLAFYAYYPLHMVILALIFRLLG